MEESYYQSPWVTQPDLCEKGDIDVLLKHGERLGLSRGSCIYRQGDLGNAHIFFLVSGRIRIVSVSPMGEERTLSVLEPGVFLVKPPFSIKASALLLLKP